MQTLLDNLTSIQWWLGVVFVGIAINLLSIFIKNRCDGYLSKMSSWWRSKSERKKKEFESDVNILKNNPQEFLMVSFIELRWMNRAIYILLFSVLLYILGLIITNHISLNIIVVSVMIDKFIIVFFYLFATIAMVVANLCFQNSINYTNVIRAARK